MYKDVCVTVLQYVSKSVCKYYKYIKKELDIKSSYLQWLATLVAFNFNFNPQLPTLMYVVKTSDNWITDWYNITKEPILNESTSFLLTMYMKI